MTPPAPIVTITAGERRRLRELLARAGEAPWLAHRPRAAVPAAVVRCGTHASDTPQPYYQGWVRTITGLPAGDHADADEYVYLASLDGDTLTPGREYPALPGGEKDDRPLYWTLPGGGGAGGGGSCSGCGWVAGLEHADCLKLTVVGHDGRCGCVEHPQVLYLRWNGSDGWEGGKDLKSCCGHATVQFEVDQEGEPHLHWNTLDKCGGGTLEYDFTLDCCTTNIAWFTAGTPDLCSDDRGGGGPAGNTMRVEVEWLTDCPNAGYNGPGWYCVGGSGDDCGDPTTLVAVHYASDPGPGPVLCSGPYDDQATAEEACPGADPATFPWCDGLATEVPARLILVITGGGSLDGLVVVLRHITTLDGVASSWFGCVSPGPCGGTFAFFLWCDADTDGQATFAWANWSVDGVPEGCGLIPPHGRPFETGPNPVASLSPFHFHFEPDESPCLVGAGPTTIDIVEP